MKGNIEVMAGIAAALGALFKSVKRKFGKRETVINMVVAGFLSFGVLAGITYWLPNYINDPRVILFVAFFAGWISNDFTDTLENFISDAYDITLDRFRGKKKDEEE